jgi:hypothetical protein
MAPNEEPTLRDGLPPLGLTVIIAVLGLILFYWLVN